MALSLLVVLFTLLSTIGYGQFICKIIFGKSANFNSGEFGLFGIVFISFISTFLHLFLPLNEFYNLILYLFGFTFFFQSKNFFLKKTKY